MKKKILKLTTEILAISLICLISFVGIYAKKTNKMENIVKGYDYSKDLSGYRELIFKVTDATEVLDANGKIIGDTDSYDDNAIESNSYTKTENKINSDDIITVDNFKKSKEIIEKRLRLLGVRDYNISIDDNTGDICLQIPENANTDHIVSNILQVGKFSIRDSENSSDVFITNNDLKKVSAVYNTETSGTTVYLQIELNKNGKKVLKEISSGEYASIDEENKENEAEEVTSDEDKDSEEDTSENEEESNKSTQKKIILSIDLNDMITTSFDDPIVNGVLNLSMGQASTDADTISDSLQSSSTIAIVLNSGNMPLTYKISENQYVNTGITKNNLNNIKYIFVGTIIILSIILIIKFKIRGIYTAIAQIGYFALYLLLIRYTNVKVSIESIVATAIVILINFIVIYKILSINETDKSLKNKKLFSALCDTILKLIPVFIIAIIFTFVNWTKVSTFGMFVFWGIALSIIDNYVLTKNMIDE